MGGFGFSGSGYIGNTTDLKRIFEDCQWETYGAFVITQASNFEGTLSELPEVEDFYYIEITNSSVTLSALPDVYANPLMYYLYLNDNNATQSEVDTLISWIYDKRDLFPNGALLAVGGNNASPSGVYQTSTNPATGKEKIYALVNDPNGEGFGRWTITYTA
jgi:hypothetical protein